MVEEVIGGDDRDDPGGTQVFHHGVQRQVAVLAQELVRVSCRHLEGHFKTGYFRDIFVHSDYQIM